MLLACLLACPCPRGILHRPAAEPDRCVRRIAKRGVQDADADADTAHPAHHPQLHAPQARNKPHWPALPPPPSHPVFCECTYSLPTLSPASVVGSVCRVCVTVLSHHPARLPATISQNSLARHRYCSYHPHVTNCIPPLRATFFLSGRPSSFGKMPSKRILVNGRLLVWSIYHNPTHQSLNPSLNPFHDIICPPKCATGEPTARTYTPTVGDDMRITRKSLTTFSGARVEPTILPSLFTLVVIAYPTRARLRAARLGGQKCTDWTGRSRRSPSGYYATIKGVRCETGHSSLLLRRALRLRRAQTR